MTVKTLIKHGRSYALVIPRAIMEQLGIEPDTPLQLSVDGRGLRIDPIRENIGPDYELIRERKKFHASLLRTSFSQGDNLNGTFTEEQVKAITKVARKNVYADTAPLTKFEQSVMLEQVLDEMLNFGPLTPFLSDSSVSKIFMNFDYTFWSEGKKLPIVFDSEQHADEILNAIKKQPHEEPDNDGWVEFRLGECHLFVPEILISE